MVPRHEEAGKKTPDLSTRQASVLRAMVGAYVGEAAPIGSTTLGLRMRREQRICLEREWKKAQTPWGDVRIKIGRYQGRATSAAPEYEDCAEIAGLAGVSTREVYDAAHAAAAPHAPKNALNARSADAGVPAGMSTSGGTVESRITLRTPSGWSLIAVNASRVP